MSSPVLDVLSNKYCAQCPLFKSLEYIHVRNQTLRTNSEYFPKTRIELLLVAESPPKAFARDNVSYFYASGERAPLQGLAFHTMCALFGIEFATKQDFLREFAKKYYLIDMAKCPVNGLYSQQERRDKRNALVSCAKYLNEELHVLDFKQAVFIGKTSFEIIKAHLDLENLRFRVIPLPFRSDKNIEGFKKGLHSALNEYTNE